MKILVTFFSRTGHNTRIAKEIARRCDAHLDAICPQHPAASWIATWRYHWEVVIQAEPPIQKPARNPANYDLVVIGVPISRVGLAPPVRSYVRQYADRIQQVAFFCAEGTGMDQPGFGELSKLCGKQPLATFTLANNRLPTIASRKQLIAFVDSFRGEVSDGYESN